MTLVNLITPPIYIVAILADSAPLALCLLALQSLFYAMCFAPAYTVLQNVVHPRTRATAFAIYMLVVNLVGLGLGPVLVGALSDFLARGAGIGAAQGGASRSSPHHLWALSRPVCTGDHVNISPVTL
jgi:MFS family permease